MLAGIGHRDKKYGSNFMIVDPESTFHLLCVKTLVWSCSLRVFFLHSTETSKEKATEFFKSMTARPDISLILVSQTVAEMIRAAIEAHTLPLPTVLEIPSKENPYDESKDPIMIRVNKLLGSQENQD